MKFYKGLGQIKKQVSNMVTNIREKVVERVATEEFNKRELSEQRKRDNSVSNFRNKPNDTINLYKCHYYSRIGGEESKSPIEIIARSRSTSKVRSTSKGRRGVDVTYLSGGVSDMPKHHNSVA